MAMILEGLRWEKSLSQICREHGILQAQYYKWCDRFLGGAKEGLGNGKKSRVKQFGEKIEEFKKVIGNQDVWKAQTSSDRCATNAFSQLFEPQSSGRYSENILAYIIGFCPIFQEASRYFAIRKEIIPSEEVVFCSSCYL